MNHLRFADAPGAVHIAELERIVRATPFLMGALQSARDLRLPDCWLVAGAVYNRVWNDLTGRPARHGIKDIDLFYYDADTSWEAEDAVIQQAAKVFASDPPVEVRNQARVHLWFEDHFGMPYPPLRNAREGIDRFACKTHAVGVRLGMNDRIEIYAPYGLADIFALRVMPNPVLDNSATHEVKAARQKVLWPELEIVPWPSNAVPK